MHVDTFTSQNIYLFVLDTMCMNQGESVDAQVVKAAVLHAVESFHGSSEAA